MAYETAVDGQGRTDFSKHLTAAGRVLQCERTAGRDLQRSLGVLERLPILKLLVIGKAETRPEPVTIRLASQRLADQSASVLPSLRRNQALDFIANSIRGSLHTCSTTTISRSDPPVTLAPLAWRAPPLLVSSWLSGHIPPECHSFTLACASGLSWHPMNTTRPLVIRVLFLAPVAVINAIILFGLAYAPLCAALGLAMYLAAYFAAAKIGRAHV